MPRKVVYNALCLYVIIRMLQEFNEDDSAIDYQLFQSLSQHGGSTKQDHTSDSDSIFGGRFSGISTNGFSGESVLGTAQETPFRSISIDTASIRPESSTPIRCTRQDGGIEKRQPVQQIFNRDMCNDATSDAVGQTIGDFICDSTGNKQYIILIYYIISNV